MTEHYTKGTTAVLAWCNRCNKRTLHAVSGKRRGLCLEDHHKEKPKEKKVEHQSLKLPM